MDFLSSILDSLGGIAGEVEAAIAFLVNLLVQLFQFIWAVIQNIATFLVNVFKHVADFFKHLWQNFFKGILTSIFNGVKRLGQFLESKLRPIINFLKKAQKFIDKAYKQYFGPILKILQKARQFLSVLKLLHIKIASQIDAVLAQAQHDIQNTFFQIRGILNTTIDLLNIIADPTKLLRRPTLILSLRRSVNALIRQVSGFPPAYFMPSPSPSAPRGVGFLPADFDVNNPVHNPPPSYYLTLEDDVPDFGFLGEGEFPDDTSIDGMNALGFFDQANWDTGDCGDPTICLSAAQQAGIGLH